MNLPSSINSVMIYFVLCWTDGHAKIAPDFIQPCNDTSRECLIKSTQAAIPEFIKGLPKLNVPPLDPIMFDKVDINITNLAFIFYNAKMTGFRNCIVDNVESYLDKRKFIMAYHCNITTRAKYDAKGQILLFPINGEGDAKIKLVNAKMALDINTKYVKDKENKYHFAIKNFKYNFDFGDRVYFNMTNLFKGNKQLSDAVLAVLNENWRAVVEDFGRPLVEQAVQFTTKAMNNFFLAVPCNELINVPIPV